LFTGAPRLTLSACGTAFYACMIGKYWFEKLARLPVEADVASELRYRTPVYAPGGLCLSVSQSARRPIRWPLCAMPKRRGSARPLSSM